MPPLHEPPEKEPLERALREEVEAARGWLDVAEKLSRAIVELRVTDVERLAALQNDAGARTGSAARQRLRVQDQWRRRAGLPESAVRLRVLLGHVPPAQAQAVGPAAEELRRVYDRVTRLNSINTALLSEAVRTSKEFVEALAGVEPSETAYTARGAVKDRTAAGPLFEGVA